MTKVASGGMKIDQLLRPTMLCGRTYSMFNGKAASGDLAEQEVFPATTDAVKLSAVTKGKAAQLDTSDSDVEVNPISSVQTSTTNTTKRVQDNKNSLIKTKMDGINGAILLVSQKADGLVGAFNMIATAISHSGQPNDVKPPIDSNLPVTNNAIPVSERALDLCAERFLGKVSDDSYADFISLLENEQKACTFLGISCNINNWVVLKWLENQAQKQ
ncbi:hypothetical protein PSTG_11574 [Puccinia striiformis f. sp. tritici PST-78]|uniref:Uncharacterized protein n=1 Tax=Puccinia striiformis f. sp. tritici PST-78 TaxID=1165861 RepID=A0A0L0V747_9BASI|nr:hypothetical protein PSTG_11574 [Puccinia striiformis f. sp. tritici PST-78]